jgi:hypothetical protein
MNDVLQRYIIKFPNEPYGLPGFRDELSPEGAYLATCMALKAKQAFSIVRMSDGETQILDYCETHNVAEKMMRFPDHWNRRYGTVDITCGEIQRRLLQAAEQCTYLAQDGWIPYCISNVRRFIHRQPFIWPNFPRVWTPEQKQAMFALADGMLIINRDGRVATDVAGGVPFDFIELDSWQQADDVVKAASANAAQLVLVSAGPASKHICPAIAAQGKVVLDVGSSAECWWNPKAWS